MSESRMSVVSCECCGADVIPAAFDAADSERVMFFDAEPAPGGEWVVTVGSWDGVDGPTATHIDAAARPYYGGGPAADRHPLSREPRLRHQHSCELSRLAAAACSDCRMIDCVCEADVPAVVIGSYITIHESRKAVEDFRVSNYQLKLTRRAGKVPVKSAKVVW